MHINRDDLDFDNISSSSAKPAQSIELSLTNAVQDIGVKRALFNSVQSLTLFFESNHGGGDGDDDDDVTRLSWVAFKGDFLRLNREGVSVLYESAARPEDHKVQGEVGMGLGSGLGSGRRSF